MISILIVIYIVFISLGLPDSVFGVAWPVVHLNFSIPVSFASVYSVVTGLCSGGASFVAGMVLRKFGTPKVTFVSILMTVVGLLGMSISPNIWIMMVFAVVMGYGAGAIDTGLNNYISLHYKARHMSWLHCFWGVGVTLSPVIMSFFLDGGSSWRTGYRVIASIQLFIALIVGLVLPKWIKVDKSHTEEIHEESSEKLKNVFSIKGLIPSILSLGCYCSMEFLLGTWGASYAVAEYSINPDLAARWVSIYYGGIMMSRLISGFLSAKLNDNALIRCGAAAATAGIIVLALPIGEASLFGLLLIGMGFGPIFPSVLHSVPYRFGKKFSADITGFHMGGAYAIGYAVQLSFGYIASNTTFRITPFILLGLICLMFTANETAIHKVGNKSDPS